jgi:superfamily I DNA/RNA helicase
MLSTVHKAKGLEADNVYILATNRMPHPKGGSEENNICYVAITRAKKNLFYVGPKPGVN